MLHGHGRQRSEGRPHMYVHKILAIYIQNKSMASHEKATRDHLAGIAHRDDDGVALRKWGGSCCESSGSTGFGFKIASSA